LDEPFLLSASSDRSDYGSRGILIVHHHANDRYTPALALTQPFDHMGGDCDVIGAPGVAFPSRDF